MNHLDFMQALGDLPESYYAECLPKKRTQRERQIPLRYSVAAFAACIGVVFTFGYLFRQHEKITEPSNTTVSMLTETTTAHSSEMISEKIEKSDFVSASTTDTGTTALTTEQTTIVIVPVFS